MAVTALVLANNACAVEVQAVEKFFRGYFDQNHSLIRGSQPANQEASFYIKKLTAAWTATVIT